MSCFSAMVASFPPFSVDLFFHRFKHHPHSDELRFERLDLRAQLVLLLAKINAYSTAVRVKLCVIVTAEWKPQPGDVLTSSDVVTSSCCELPQKHRSGQSGQCLRVSFDFTRHRPKVSDKANTVIFPCELARSVFWVRLRVQTLRSSCPASESSHCDHPEAND